MANFSATSSTFCHFFACHFLASLVLCSSATADNLIHGSSRYAVNQSISSTIHLQVNLAPALTVIQADNIETEEIEQFRWAPITFPELKYQCAELFGEELELLAKQDPRFCQTDTTLYSLQQIDEQLYLLITPI